MESQGQSKKLTRIVKKMLEDHDFRQEVLADPLGVLEREGVELPPEAEGELLSRLQEPPAAGSLTGTALEDEALDKIMGGSGRDQDKPCGNRSCYETYNAPGCWIIWFFTGGECSSAKFK